MKKLQVDYKNIFIDIVKSVISGLLVLFIWSYYATYTEESPNLWHALTQYINVFYYVSFYLLSIIIAFKIGRGKYVKENKINTDWLLLSERDGDQIGSIKYKNVIWRYYLKTRNSFENIYRDFEPSEIFVLNNVYCPSKDCGTIMRRNGERSKYLKCSKCENEVRISDKQKSDYRLEIEDILQSMSERAQQQNPHRRLSLNNLKFPDEL